MGCAGSSSEEDGEQCSAAVRVCLLSVCLSDPHDLVSLLHSLSVGGAVWLNSANKYPNIVSSYKPQTDAAVLRKRHGLQV